MYIDETGRKIMHGIVKIEQQRLNEAPKEEEEDTHECEDSTSGPEPCYDSDSSEPYSPDPPKPDTSKGSRRGSHRS